MKTVYLIRHAEPAFPRGERMCLGRTDLPLSEEGLRQAERMAERLPPVAAVYASPLRRAVQTARAIGLPVTAVEDLREMDAGLWDGLTFTQIKARFPELYAARGTDPSLPLPEAEDKDAACARFAAAMEQIAAACPGDMAVVAHAAVITAFLQSLGGKGEKLDYGQRATLLWQAGSFYIKEENDHAEYV